MKMLQKMIVLALLFGVFFAHTLSAALPGTYETNGIKIIVGSAGKITSVTVTASDDHMSFGHTFTGSEIEGNGIYGASGAWHDQVISGNDYTIRDCGFSISYYDDGSFRGDYAWSYSQKQGSSTYNNSGGNNALVASGNLDFILKFKDASPRIVRNSGATLGIAVVASKTTNADVTVSSTYDWIHPTQIEWTGQTFQLTLDPNTGVKRQGAVDLSYHGYTCSLVITQSAALSPEIVVEQPAGTSLEDGSGSIDFGAVNVGSSSPRTFTIRNIGTADLTGLAVTKSGSNAADCTVGSLGATTLAPGEVATFTVTFTPGAAGPRTAALRIASNDDTSPFDIALKGIGVGTVPPSITTRLLSVGTGGAAYSQTLVATGGVKPYTWSVIDGSLPEGLSLSASGQISGTPTTSGISEFTVQVTAADTLSTALAYTLAIQWPFNYSEGSSLIEITGYSVKPTGVLVIPPAINGKPVKIIGNYAFSGCSGLTSVTIPSSVTSIGSYAFQSCSGLTSVTIPSGVTSIGSSAFKSCSGLTSVMIPSSVTAIGSSAFYNCSKLTSVTLPASVTSIGGNAFSGCSSLTTLTVDAANPNYSSEDGVLFDKLKTRLIQFPNGKPGDYTLPATVINLLDSAFYGCSRLTSVTIPPSVTYLPRQLFIYCSSLTSVTLPASVTSIGNNVFSYCSKLASVTIPSSVTSIGSEAFYGCSSLTSVAIPPSVTSIGDDAFNSCYGLTSVTIPPSVTSIGNNVFYNCSGLTSVTIPSSVTSIGNNAFCSCSKLASVTIPSSVTSIGNNAFYNCSGLTSLTLSTGVTSIGNNVFYNCSGLTSLTLSTGVTSIGSYAFYNCSSLTSVAIPSSVTSIGNNAFYACGNLTILTIPSSVTTIGDGAFCWCSGLKSLIIPSSVTSIGNSVFYRCGSLTSLTIPASVTSIGSEAFYGCSSLTLVTIPPSVTSIGNNVFSYCSKLTTATFLGNAPGAFGASVFFGAASGFKLYYFDKANGFTSPTWKGYTAVKSGTSAVTAWLCSASLPDNADLQSAPNADGVPLLMAYALNLDPARSQCHKLPRPTVSGSQISLSFYAGSVGVIYEVQSSADLVTWETTGVTYSPLDASNICTATLTATGPRRFLRLVVRY